MVRARVIDKNITFVKILNFFFPNMCKFQEYKKNIINNGSNNRDHQIQLRI